MLTEISFAILVAGAALVVTAGESRTRVWADISVIWLLAPALFFALSLLAILITTIYGMAKLLQAIPLYTAKAQGIFVRLSAGTRKLADGAVQPFVWFRQAAAVIKSILRQ